MVLVMCGLVSCDQKHEQKVKLAENPDKQAVAAVITPEVDAISLEKRADGLMYLPGATQPFTGTDVEPDHFKAKEQNRPGFVMVTPYQDGRIHGARKIYYPKNKGLQEERVYEHGEAIQSTVYYAGGQKKIFAELNAKDVAEGKYLRWYENGVMATDGAHDEDERFHGDSKEYTEDGKLKGQYVWEHGKLAKVIFETPEQKAERLHKYGKLAGEE